MISVAIRDILLDFETEPSLFSPKAADRGTLALLSAADDYREQFFSITSEEKILDLGCGYGLAGIYFAKRVGGNRVHMSDADPAAVDCARANAKRNDVPDIKVFHSDGFNDIPETGYTMILSNPPYHSDFSVPKLFIEKGFNRLVIGGIMGMVTKRREWYKRKMIAVFGGVSITEKDGYFIFMSEKRHNRYGGGSK